MHKLIFILRPYAGVKFYSKTLRTSKFSFENPTQKLIFTQDPTHKLIFIPRPYAGVNFHSKTGRIFKVKATLTWF